MTDLEKRARELLKLSEGTYFRNPLADNVDAMLRFAAEQREELELIHKILLCVAECPPVEPTDTLTVRYVKDLCHAFNAQSKVADERVKAERERCAKVCRERVPTELPLLGREEGATCVWPRVRGGDECAEAIERGTEE